MPAIAARATKPPTTPPAMAPAFELELEPELVPSPVPDPVLEVDDEGKEVDGEEGEMGGGVMPVSLDVEVVVELNKLVSLSVTEAESVGDVIDPVSMSVVVVLSLVVVVESLEYSDVSEKGGGTSV